MECRQLEISVNSTKVRIDILLNSQNVDIKLFQYSLSSNKFCYYNQFMNGDE